MTKRPIPPIKGHGARATIVPAAVVDQARSVIADEEPNPDLALPATSTATQMHPTLYEGRTKKVLITGQQHNELLRLIRNGQPPTLAASLIGLPRDKFSSWLDIGLSGHEPYYTLTLNVEKAQAEYFGKLNAVLHQAMLPRPAKYLKDEHGIESILPARDGDPKIAQFMIERQFPDQMGNNSTVTVKLDKQVTLFVQILEEELDPESFRRVLTRMGVDAPSRAIEAEGDPIH